MATGVRCLGRVANAWQGRVASTCGKVEVQKEILTATCTSSTLPILIAITIHRTSPLVLTHHGCTDLGIVDTYWQSFNFWFLCASRKSILIYLPLSTCGRPAGISIRARLFSKTATHFY